MPAQQTKSETKEVRQERAAEFWLQRIETGQSQQAAAQQHKQEAREADKPRQPRP